MTEMEKMLAGKLYDPSDAELSAMRVRAHELSRQISGAPEGERKALLRELIPQMGADVDIIGPVFFDYGSFTVIGERTFINADLKVLDCCPVTIGKNVMIGTGCSLLTPMHPLLARERNLREKPGSPRSGEQSCFSEPGKGKHMAGAFRAGSDDPVHAEGRGH